MRFPSIPFLVRAVADVFRRFPLAMLFAIIGSIAIMSYNEYYLNAYQKGNYDPYPTFDWLKKVFMTSLLGLPLSIALLAYAETNRWGMKKQLIGQTMLLLLCVGYYFTTDLSDSWNGRQQGFNFFGLWAVAHLLVALAPYLHRGSTDDFWAYNTRIFGVFVVGTAYTIVLWLGVSAALLAVDQLFEVRIQSKAYYHAWVVFAGIFNTCYFLYHHPRVYEFEPKPYASVLVKFILIPISILYLLILYAFSAKILALLSLPKGWVAKLVIGFAGAGIFTWLLNFSLARLDKSEPHRSYSRWFWPVLLPMIALLFIGIGKRISDYGITEPRYIVAHTGVWLALCALYYALSRRDNPKFIPVSLGLFILFALFSGPFSMINVSYKSQEGIFQKIMEQSGRWENGQLKPSDTLLSQQDANKVRDFMDYVYIGKDFRAKAGKWMETVPDSIFRDSTKTSQNRENIYRWLGIKIMPEIGKPQPLSNLVYVSFKPGVVGKEMSMNQAFVYKIENGQNVNKQGRYFVLENRRNYLKMLEVDSITQDTKQIDEIDLRKLLGLRGLAENFRELEANEGVFEVEGQYYKARIILQSCNIRAEPEGDYIETLNGLLFVEKK